GVARLLLPRLPRLCGGEGARKASRSFRRTSSSDRFTYNTHMSASSDVLVVGGGVIGLTTAYFSARDGVRVTVVDRGEMGREASWAGAGIIPPGNPDRAAHPGDRLRALSAKMYPALSAELPARCGVDNGYVRCRRVAT